MTSARDRILARIRNASAERDTGAVNGRIQQQEPGPRPQRLAPELVEEFSTRLRANSAQVLSAQSVPEIGALLTRLLLECDQLPGPCGADARLLHWLEPAGPLRNGGWQAGDRACVSHAENGIAETGSLVLPATATNPGTMNFLPDRHIVLLKRSDIVDTLDDAWAAQSQRPCPRALHLVSGPSRTADIEQTIQLGAHGPRELYVILY